MDKLQRLLDLSEKPTFGEPMTDEMHKYAILAVEMAEPMARALMLAEEAIKRYHDDVHDQYRLENQALAAIEAVRKGE